ncbi:MAG TPA: hypothetical protein EYH03_04705 [Chromatiales bacterium]|nr:hypothetical protein [Chromatiales bacterium]
MFAKLRAFYLNAGCVLSPYRLAGDDPLASLGFVTAPDNDALKVEDIVFLSGAEIAGFEPGLTRRIVGLEWRLEQTSKEWFLLSPLLFGWVVRCQRLRNVK